MVQDYNKKELKIGDVVMVSDHKWNEKTIEMVNSKEKGRKATIIKIDVNIVDIKWLNENRISKGWIGYRFVKIIPSLKQFLETKR